MHTAYDRAHRLAGKAEQEAAPVDDALLEDGAERDLAASACRARRSTSSRPPHGSHRS